MIKQTKLPSKYEMIVIYGNLLNMLLKVEIKKSIN